MNLLMAKKVVIAVRNINTITALQKNRVIIKKRKCSQQSY